MISLTTVAGLLQTDDGPLDQKNMTAQLSSLKLPRIVIRKSKRALLVYDGDEFVKSYNVVLGFAPEGDKGTEGDGRTPEGEFYVFTKNPKSRFHLSLGISYPNKLAADRGIRDGLISEKDRDQIYEAIDNAAMPPQKTPLGGEIYIHGGGTAADWTDGCIALNNEEIEELFKAIPVGTPVSVLP